MDVLNVNNRREGEMLSGVSEQDEWFEHKNKLHRDPYARGSTNVHRMAMSSGGNLETTQVSRSNP